jgi:hypothetical protein
MPLADNLSNESVYSLDVGDTRSPNAPDRKGVNLELARKGERLDLRALDLLPWKNDPAPGVQNIGQRSQGRCGNCWVWAGTTCLEASLAKHLRDKGQKYPVRLSIQLLNSNFCRFATRVLDHDGLLIAYSGTSHLNEVMRRLDKTSIYKWTICLYYNGQKSSFRRTSVG